MGDLGRLTRTNRLVYGGAGTLTKIKHEMRKEIDRNTPHSD